MMVYFARPMALLGIVALVLLAGCQPGQGSAESDHGHTHEHATGPKSFEEGVARLAQIQGQIETAMNNDDPDAAHDPLHDVGHLLDKLPELAADTDLKESEWKEVKEEADRLFKAFGDVDSAFHSDGDKVEAFESSKSTIDEGIANLVAKVEQLGIELPTLDDSHSDGHDHSDHDHGDDHDHDHGDDHDHDHDHDHGHDHDDHDHGGEDDHDHEDGDSHR